MFLLLFWLHKVFAKKFYSQNQRINYLKFWLEFGVTNLLFYYVNNEMPHRSQLVLDFFFVNSVLVNDSS